MGIQFNNRYGSCQTNTNCVSKFGCPDGQCPDFIIKRHDTKPALKISIEDCNGPFDFRGLVIEANMWALAKLKTNITEEDTYFRFSDDVGFDQVMVGDIIVMDRVRLPERMLVIGFDEINRLIQVQRGYQGTEACPWKKGSSLRVFRILNSPAEAEMSFEDVVNIEGVTETDVLQSSYLVYEWNSQDTCLPGCYWFEFKVLKMIDIIWYLPGGHWKGEVHTGDDGFFYTGVSTTDSSVKISYNQLEDKYFLPDIIWEGESHLYIDGFYYTGSEHDEGSVQLNRTGMPSSDSTAYNSEGVISMASISITPSFTSEDDPANFGCILGDGVEWVRRYPSTGAFLIKISDSPTVEF